MAHHTATHLISAAARSVLGKHAWQEGAKKGPSKAHIDISHYEKLTESQIREIEDRANSYITPRHKGDGEGDGQEQRRSQSSASRYTKGTACPAKRLRIVQIKDLKGNLIDAEACGGLHLAGRESTVGLIKIISSSRIHDGINRIEFVAGPAAQEHINGIGASIDSIAKLAGVDRDKLSTGLSAKLEELNLYRERYEKAELALSGYIAKELAEASEEKISKILDYDRKMLRKIAIAFAESNKHKIIMLSNSDNYVITISGAESGISALEFTEEQSKLSKNVFRGGGSRRMAEGRLVKLE